MSRKVRPANHLHPALVGAVFGVLLVFLGWLAGDPARVEGFDRLSGQVLALGAMVLLLAVILFGLAFGGALIADLILPADRLPRRPRSDDPAGTRGRRTGSPRNLAPSGTSR